MLGANDAWMRNLLPAPIKSHKQGTILIVAHAKRSTSSVKTCLLFAQDSYIVPKADGRIVIGATVEAGSFDPNVTPAGMMHIFWNMLCNIGSRIAGRPFH